jgi:hypothetical protein
MKYSAAAIVFENAVSLCVFNCWPLNGESMLSDASMMTAMRRPGYETCFADSVECGSASARQKNGRPARNNRNGACRTNASGERRMRGSTAGSAIAVRPGSLPRSERHTSTIAAITVSSAAARNAALRALKTRSPIPDDRHSFNVRETSSMSAFSVPMFVVPWLSRRAAGVGRFAAIR